MKNMPLQCTINLKNNLKASGGVLGFHRKRSYIYV